MNAHLLEFTVQFSANKLPNIFNSDKESERFDDEDARKAPTYLLQIERRHVLNIFAETSFRRLVGPNVLYLQADFLVRCLERANLKPLFADRYVLDSNPQQVIVEKFILRIVGERKIERRLNSTNITNDVEVQHFFKTPNNKFVTSLNTQINVINNDKRRNSDLFAITIVRTCIRRVTRCTVFPSNIPRIFGCVFSPTITF